MAISFSGRVKEELSRYLEKTGENQREELFGMLTAAGRMAPEGPVLSTDNEWVTRKFFTLLQKTINIGTEEWGPAFFDQLLQFPLPDQSPGRKAFLRGAFLASGSMSDPSKSYHWEVVFPDEERAGRLVTVMEGLFMAPKVAARKRSFIVYVKDQSQISDILAAMGASVAVMDLANVKIMKEMRSSVNRQVNCEAANIGKTVSAAMRQMEDIEYIQERVGFENLPEALKQMAELRLGYPSATLQELGNMSDPRIGKSGVNHRLRRLSEIAESLRRNEEEKL